MRVLDFCSMLTRLSALCVIALLAACSGNAVQEDAPSTEPLPELNLNLPVRDCKCEGLREQNYTFLEKGFIALEDGEYLESLQYFQRYQRIESGIRAKNEARIAIAYLSILPDSPIFDRDAARESYAKLELTDENTAGMDERILLLRDSLETFLDMEQQIQRLMETNSNLRSELLKREAAIKRLRDLTLGREPEPGG